MNENLSLSIGHFHATLRDVELSIGLVIDTITVSGTDLVGQREAPYIKAVKPGKVEMVILESAVSRFLEAIAPMGLKSFRVSLSDGLMTIDCVKTILVDLRATAVCKLRIENGKHVFVELESVTGAPVKQLIQNQLEKLNPLIDSSVLPFPARIERLDVAGGKLIVHGFVSPPS